MSVRSPTPELVERIASEEGIRVGVTLAQVLGVDRRKAPCEARRRALARLVREEGFPILGVALIWGCDRRAVQRAVRRAA